MLLTQTAHESSAANPVLALTVSGHHNINYKQMESQRVTQARYLKWAKKRGYHIEHSTVQIGVGGKELFVDYGPGQSALWISHLAPYLPEKCVVSFGYIHRDAFWHIRREHEDAFVALATLMEGDWQSNYPYEWVHKSSILKSLGEWDVPKNCWWTCEDPKRVGVACGKCNKCIELHEGFVRQAQ